MTWECSLKPIGTRCRVKKTLITIGGINLAFEDRSIPGVDDPIYEKNPSIWEAVPRGQTNVYASVSMDESKPVLVCALRGLRKFGYTDSRYGRRDQVTHVIAIDKENGECAHVSAFCVDETEFWVVGSKHVHLAFRDASAVEDLGHAEYKTQRYRVALKIANHFLSELCQITPEQRKQFFTTLCERKLTANAEAIFADSQHIVDYDGINQLRWFALSCDAPSAAGLCLHPDESQQVFAACGLHPIVRSDKTEYRSEQYRELVEAIGQRINSEGVVMYGCAADGRVVCLWKEKSYPYTMERVVREAIKRGMTGNQLAGYVQGRLKQQKPELRKYFASWETTRLPFLVEFSAFVQEKFPIGPKGRDDWSISCQWLSLQKEFSQLSPADRTALAKKFQLRQLSGVAAINSIVLVGPPGSGKSSLARSLVSLLQFSGKIPVWLNQDEAGNRKAYLDVIKRSIATKETTHVILDKSNMEKGNRDDYVQLGLTPLVTVVFMHPDGSESLRELCVKRILERGDAHRSLCPANFTEKRQNPKAELNKIIGSFIERADIEENFDVSCTWVDCTLPPEQVVANVWRELCQADTTLPALDVIEGRISESVQLAGKYEALLQRLSASQQLFAAVKLDKATVAAELTKLIPKQALNNKTMREEFHITVKYFGGVVDPVWFVEHAERLDTAVAVHITEIVYDDKGVAAVVEATFPCQNKVPHITLACSNGTPPVYSNTLVRKTEGVKRVKVDVNVSGVAVFM